MSWKGYFNFNNNQRIGICVLIVLVVLVSLFNLLIPLFQKKVDTLHIDKEFMAKAESFKLSLREYKRQREYSFSQQKNNKSRYSNSKWEKDYISPPTLFQFDPNTLDSAGFVKLGLKPFQAKNILKFRSKEGKFRNPADFSKIYGLSEDQFKTLEPYINIPEKEIEIIEEIIPLNININTTDTTELLKIKGVYPSLAKRIIAYRNTLGGYVKAEQLSEVWEITPTQIEKITPHIKFDMENIRKISVNRASVEYMRNHPYINFYQAKAIYEYRRNKGKVKSIEELKQLKDESITDDFWEKIEIYLDFTVFTYSKY